MQGLHRNVPSKVNYTKQDKKPLSESVSLNKSKYGTLNENSKVHKSKFKVYDDDDLDLAPYVVKRKDRLIQELETSLAEMDGQLESASKLEEQKTAVVDQRASLLKEIEAAVNEIQGHVINAREMEIEKKAIENECNGLKNQVKHLRMLLDDKQTPNNKQWNYVDLMDEEGSMRASLAHANSRNHVLEKEVKKLRLASERMHLKERSSRGSADFEKLNREYADLEKLLQVAESSEDNIAQELATCHQTMAQMQDDYEQLEKVRSIIEEERDSLVLEKAELEMDIKKLRDDKQNCNVIEKEPSSVSSLDKDKVVLQRKLQKNEDNCEKLEQENTSYKQRIQELQNELRTLTEETGVKLESEIKVENSNPNQQLKSALVKLNKENSTLQVSLEKAEQELSDLRISLEKEQANKEATKTDDKSHQLRPALDKLNKENLELQTDLEKAEKEISALKICLEEERGSKRPEDVTPDATPKKAEKTKKIKGLKLNTKKSKKEKKDASSEEVDSEKDEFEVLKREKFNLEGECQALSETVTKIAGEKRSLRNQIEELTNEKTKLDTKISELETLIKELDEVKVKKEELDQKYQETETCLAYVSAELEKTSEKNASLNNLLQRARGEKDALILEQREFQEVLEAIKKEMESVRKDVSNKSTEIRLLRKKHEEEKRRLIGMKEGGNKELDRLKTELKEISGKVMQSTQDSEHDSKDVVSAIENLHQDIDELNQMNTELEHSKQELEKQLDEISKKAEELQKESAKASDMAMEKAVELSRIKRSLERKIEKLNKENAEHRRKLGEVTPAMSITPRMSPETIQVQNAQIVQSQYPPPVSPRPQVGPPPPQRSEPLRLSGVRSEAPNKFAPPGTYSGGPNTRHGSQDYQNRGPVDQRRKDPNPRYGPPGPQNEEADTRHGPPERSPPPYSMSKRKSLDDVLMREKQRGNPRYLPVYPGRERRISENNSRPHSGSLVTVVARSIGDKDDVKNVSDSSSSFARERRRSDSGYTYRKRRSDQAE
ncbi:hypothetical protein QZH41_012244, partial [Actinostola sp. cb2023]